VLTGRQRVGICPHGGAVACSVDANGAFTLSTHPCTLYEPFLKCRDQVLAVTEPPPRKAGTMVKTVDELLCNEAEIYCEGDAIQILS